FIGIMTALSLFYLSPLSDQRGPLEKLRFVFKHYGFPIILFSVLYVMAFATVLGQFAWNWLEGHEVTLWTSYIILIFIVLLFAVLALLAFRLAWRLSLMQWQI